MVNVDDIRNLSNAVAVLRREGHVDTHAHFGPLVSSRLNHERRVFEPGKNLADVGCKRLI